jgi:CRP/FNR family transcriptional regulator
MQDMYSAISAKFPLLSALSVEEQAVVKANLGYVKFADRQLLITKAEQCKHVFFVLTGSIRVYMVSEEGREITLYRLVPGDVCLFTLSCLAGLGELLANAEASAGTEVLTLPGIIYQNLMHSSPTLHKHTMDSALTRLRQVMKVVELVTFVPIKQRVGLFLCDAMHKQGSVKLKLTREQIALEVGTAREVVSRVLGEFEQEGVLTLGRGSVKVLQRDVINDFCLV